MEKCIQQASATVYNWIERHTFCERGILSIFADWDRRNSRENCNGKRVRATHNMLPLILQTADGTMVRCVYYFATFVSPQ